MAEKDMTDAGVNDEYEAPQAPSREEALTGAVLVASQPGARPDALVGNGAPPQAGARLEQIPDSGKVEINGECVNDPSKPPLGPGSDQPPVEAPRQSTDVAKTTEEAWEVSDGGDVPDSTEEKSVVQVERVSGKAGKDNIAVPAVYERIVYSDGSVANILAGTPNPEPDKEVVQHTKGTVEPQPNQQAQADEVAHDAFAGNAQSPQNAVNTEAEPGLADKRASELESGEKKPAKKAAPKKND